MSLQTFIALTAAAASAAYLLREFVIDNSARSCGGCAKGPCPLTKASAGGPTPVPGS